MSPRNKRGPAGTHLSAVSHLITRPLLALVSLLRERAAGRGGATDRPTLAELTDKADSPASENSHEIEKEANSTGAHAAPSARVPEHPAQFVPSPFDLERAYHQALAEIHRARGTGPPTGDYAIEVRDQTFRAFFAALSDGCCAIIVAHNPAGSWAEQYGVRCNTHVVASAPGSGKSTLAKAFAVALARETRAGPYPFGSIFVVQHIATAHALFLELCDLLPPDSVAVFTTKHDASQPFPDYAETFWVGELEPHPIIVVTHEFYMGVRGEQARWYTRDGVTFPRVITFIDERANEIAVYDVDPSALEGVLKFVQRDRQAPPELLGGFLELVQFAHTKRGREQGIEIPSDDTAGWQAVVKATAYLRGEEAAKYARSATARRPALEFDAIFGFANALAEDRAFIERGNKGVINFVGYERALPRVPGMVLLDATADIDGITKVCGHRDHAKTPVERYDRLKVMHVPSVAAGNLRRWLDEPNNMYAYAGQIQELIRRHVRPGERVLVVCPRAAVVAEDILGWSQHVLPFLSRSSPEQDHGTADETEFSSRRAWNFEGRLVAVTWFGGYGIGANLWRDADVVIVCDDFFLPQRVVRATLQGLGTTGPLKASSQLTRPPGATPSPTCRTATSSVG
jgi:hypothetical protein